MYAASLLGNLPAQAHTFFIGIYVVKGFTPELLVEIPPYRLLLWRAMLQKLWMRVYGFLAEAVPIILGAVLVINLLYFIGVFEAIANFTAPVITNLRGCQRK
ncbi:MAG TPA: hypothetical protein VMW45_02040 [Dehalococcoidia bacterium]|nr:hypothetical protein [Dehalococcoidia bacterium]